MRMKISSLFASVDEGGRAPGMVFNKFRASG
jgi:hypothetical protein